MRGQTLSRLTAVVAILGVAALSSCSQPPADASREPTTAAAPAAYHRTPVLLVHGYGDSSRAFDGLLAHLKASYPDEYLLAIDIDPADLANGRAAQEQIAPTVDQLLASASAAASAAGYPGAPPTKVDIIGHSMGAVSSRWYTTQIRPDRVRTWISVNGANHGTNWACQFNDEPARELCPAFSSAPDKQPLMTTLNGTPLAPADESPYGRGADQPGVESIRPDALRSILYIAIRLQHDDFILPAESAMIDGAGASPVTVPTGLPVTETSPGNYLFQAPTDHDAILTNQAFLLLVSAILAAP